MYKDRDKQRETTRLRVRRYRERKGVTDSDDVTPCVTPNVTPVIKTKEEAVKAVEKLRKRDEILAVVGGRFPNGRCRGCGNFECTC